MDSFGAEREILDQEFSGIDARGGVWADRFFEACVFKHVQLSDATFQRCRFVDCVFEDTDLSNLAVPGSSFREVSWRNSKLLGVDWTKATALAHLSFIDCVLSYSSFIGLDLRRLRLEKCVAREIELGRANLADAVCRGTDFAGARFAGTNLTGADFCEAINYAFDPRDNMVKKAKFSLPEAMSLLYALDIVLET